MLLVDVAILICFLNGTPESDPLSRRANVQYGRCNRGQIEEIVQREQN